MNLKLGDTVLVRSTQASNGTNVHPAIVTRLWSDPVSPGAAINLTVLPDCAAPFCSSSVAVYPTRGEAEAARSTGSVAWLRG